MDRAEYTFRECVPHSEPMTLLDDALFWQEGELQGSVTIHAESPFFEGDGVPAWVGIEYMAQAIAAYAGLQARLRGDYVKIGFLVGTRKYRSSVSCFPLGSCLSVHVCEEIYNPDGLSVFKCRIETDDILVEANLNVFQPKDPSEFLMGEING